MSYVDVIRNQTIGHGMEVNFFHPHNRTSYKVILYVNKIDEVDNHTISNVTESTEFFIYGRSPSTLNGQRVVPNADGLIMYVKGGTAEVYFGNMGQQFPIGYVVPNSYGV